MKELTEAGHVFACTCSRKMLEAAPRNADGETIYPGQCRGAAALDGIHSLRLRVIDDADALMQFADCVVGEIAQNVATDVGDFVLRRADGCYAYQLAVVVDDALAGVTDVVRGADLLLNTPRQIYLQQRLGVATPRYMHVPLVRNADGEKLSKQTLALAIDVDAPLATLHAAWAFLKQDELGAVQTVDGFWKTAFSVWDPQRLRRREHFPEQNAADPRGNEQQQNACSRLDQCRDNEQRVGAHPTAPFYFQSNARYTRRRRIRRR